jgi:hypothetical protein
MIGLGVGVDTLRVSDVAIAITVESCARAPIRCQRNSRNLCGKRLCVFVFSRTGYSVLDEYRYVLET